jgi:hypothetical protein
MMAAAAHGTPTLDSEGCPLPIMDGHAFKVAAHAVRAASRWQSASACNGL